MNVRPKVQHKIKNLPEKNKSRTIEVVTQFYRIYIGHKEQTPKMVRTCLVDG